MKTKSKTKEVPAKDLKVGDVIIAKQGGRRYTVVAVAAGLGGKHFPYLTLKCNGRKAEHDTSFDSRSATYTVVVPAPLAECCECLEEYEADELDDGLCDECRKEECPTCEGTGDSDEWNEEEGILPCDDCGGDGVI